MIEEVEEVEEEEEDSLQLRIETEKKKCRNTF
jgi:hypothetical protein